MWVALALHILFFLSRVSYSLPPWNGPLTFCVSVFLWGKGVELSPLPKMFLNRSGLKATNVSARTILCVGKKAHPPQEGGTFSLIGTTNEVWAVRERGLVGVWTALGIQCTDEGEDLQVTAAAVWEEVLEEAGGERFPWEKLGEGLLVRSCMEQ